MVTKPRPPVQLADDVGLPGDEVGDQLGLEATPGEVVLRLDVALRPPELAPPRRAGATSRRGPTPGSARSTVAVPRAQPVDEPLEHVGVVSRRRPGSLSTW